MGASHCFIVEKGLLPDRQHFISKGGVLFRYGPSHWTIMRLFLEFIHQLRTMKASTFEHASSH